MSVAIFLPISCGDMPAGQLVNSFFCAAAPPASPTIMSPAIE